MKCNKGKLQNQNKTRHLPGQSERPFAYRSIRLYVVKQAVKIVNCCKNLFTTLFHDYWHILKT